MATAHLFNCNSKTEVVTSLKLAYSSEDVLALNMDNIAGNGIGSGNVNPYTPRPAFI